MRTEMATPPCSTRHEPARSVDPVAQDDQTLLCEIRAYQAHLETATTPPSAAAGCQIQLLVDSVISDASSISSNLPECITRQPRSQLGRKAEMYYDVSCSKSATMPVLFYTEGFYRCLTQ